MNDLQDGIVFIVFGVAVLVTDFGTWINRHSSRSKLFLLKPDGAFTDANTWIWRIIGAIACLVGLSLALKSVHS